MKSQIEKSIEVDVPVHTAYNQWTQLEEFPRFMPGVESIEQLDDRHVRWRMRLGGAVREWEAEICEQIPDKRIAWRSVSGPPNAGVVTFHRLSDQSSKVMVQLEYEPEGFVETAGDVLGIVQSRVSSDLESFKDFIERRGRETGEWRGAIPAPDERPR